MKRSLNSGRLLLVCSIEQKKDTLKRIYDMRLNQLFLLLIGISLSVSISSCFVIDNQYTSVAPGYWRATLQLVPKDPTTDKTKATLSEIRDIRYEEVAEGELPFVFELIYDNEKDFHIELINGEERIPLYDISIGRNIRNGDDTILIDIPIYESFIQAKYDQGIMQGHWVVKTRNNYRIPFVAKFGENHRFTKLAKDPVMDVSGKWAVTFGLAENEPYPAIGEFTQKGNHLTGTFLTETGDYRFLEGTIQANKLYLSCFDGSHAFLFEGKILEDSTIIGSFRSGSHYRTTWNAKRDPNAQLARADTLTFLNPGYSSIDFTFPNTEGKMISLTDERYQGKAKVIQIFGTWCPNCRDETEFLVDYLKSNPTDKLEVIALAFEKHRDGEKAIKAINTYREKMNIPYEMLHAGYYNKSEAAAALPMLNHVLSYPTMIFLDKNNQVKKIHTGFSGPATSTYPTFKREFEQFVTELIAE